MNVLTALFDYLVHNNITIPHPMKGILYGGQLVSTQFIKHNEQLIQGVHFVSTLINLCLI